MNLSVLRMTAHVDVRQSAEGKASILPASRLKSGCFDDDGVENTERYPRRSGPQLWSLVQTPTRSSRCKWLAEKCQPLTLLRSTVIRNLVHEALRLSVSGSRVCRSHKPSSFVCRASSAVIRKDDIAPASSLSDQTARKRDGQRLTPSPRQGRMRHVPPIKAAGRGTPRLAREWKRHSG